MLCRAVAGCGLEAPSSDPPAADARPALNALTTPQVPGHALGACKEAIDKAAADALLAYRTHCAAASSSGQLILPEALKLLPLYTLALTKAPCFRCAACAASPQRALVSAVLGLAGLWILVKF